MGLHFHNPQQSFEWAHKDFDRTYSEIAGLPEHLNDTLRNGYKAWLEEESRLWVEEGKRLLDLGIQRRI